VNSAAVNYYFRSKDALIERCMQTTLENAFDFDDFALLPGGSAVEHCKAIFQELLEGGLRYPGVSRAHFSRLINTGQQDTLLKERLNLFVIRLANDLENRGAPLSGEALYLACVQMTDALLMAVLDPHLFGGAAGCDLTDAHTRDVYINRLVERLLMRNPEVGMNDGDA